MNLWRRFKIWYLGPEFPPDYIPLQRGPGIPWPGERRQEWEAHLRVQEMMRNLREVKERDQQQRDS